MDDATPKDKTASKRKTAERERKRQAGFKKVEVWVADRPEAVVLIRAAEQEANEKYPPLPKEVA